eukprot:TRINITY_DN13795_c0_g1_i3.p2 TRINITY_DN13795_c0_g1~~TRINITY_DN13795_c0_g1_i3.p2  ORF type:complete len:164 (-),score=11.71 TRINITY_DN13795_c0_g1_i3:208-630(-)
MSSLRVGNMYVVHRSRSQGVVGTRQRKPLHLKAQIVADKGAAPLDITKMSPLGDRILLKPLKLETKTLGGVVLPGTVTSSVGSMEQAVFGEVLAKGEEVKLEINSGDTIIFSKYGTADVEVGQGEKVILAYEKSIMAVVS